MVTILEALSIHINWHNELPFSRYFKALLLGSFGEWISSLIMVIAYISKHLESVARERFGKCTASPM